MVARVEPSPGVVGRLSAIATRLPEAIEEDAWTGVRWRIRSRTFAHVMVAQPGYESSYREVTGDASVRTILTFHAEGDELQALTHQGVPFYKPTWSTTVVGVVLDEHTDWEEIAELVTDSYRCRAPRKLARLLDNN